MLFEPVNGFGKTKRRLSLRGNYDLWLLALLALALPGLVMLPASPLRLAIGLPMVLLAPGYALTEAIFAQRDNLDGLARLAISFGLSVAILPLLALILSALPWGIQLWPMTIALAATIFSLTLLALFRRWSVSNSAVPAAPSLKPASWWRATSLTVKLSAFIGLLIIAGLVTWGAVIFTNSNQVSRLTDFYVVGTQGLVENYPREVVAGAEIQLQTGLTNREGTIGRYRIEIRSEGRLLMQTELLTLENGAQWEQPLRFKLDKAGDDQKIDVLLFYNNQTTPYRQLRLWVNVRPAAQILATGKIL